MDGFMQLLDENYKKKHYPNGYFNAVVQRNQSMTAVYVIFSVLVLFSIFLFYLGIPGILWGGSNRIMDCIAIGFGLLIMVLAIFLIRVAKKLKGKNREDWIRDHAENSGYSIGEVEEFGRQLTTGAAYYLTLTGKFDKRKEYIMTDDFLLISPLIFKLSDMKAACLFNLVESYGAGAKVKFKKTLQVGLINSRNRVWIETEKKRGNAFIAMLKEKNPAIETKSGSILNDKEFDALVKEYITPR